MEAIERTINPGRAPGSESSQSYLCINKGRVSNYFMFVLIIWRYHWRLTYSINTAVAMGLAGVPSKRIGKCMNMLRVLCDCLQSVASRKVSRVRM